MDLAQAMRTAAAVRRFRPDPVPDDALYHVLDSARFAPSWGNRQGWRVTNEFSTRFPDRPRAGPLMANVGGFLTSCLYGLPGLVLQAGDPQHWARRPVVMPELWDGVEVDRIWVRGNPARVALGLWNAITMPST